MKTAEHENPLRELARLGQSVWLDDIRRGWLQDGTLARLIEHDGLAGVTSNPAIFAKAIETGKEYESQIATLARRGLPVGTIYETLALEDVRAAADLLRPVYEVRAGQDGFVSLEVSPHLADDTKATLDEARRLWRAFDRPNAMIKVPGTSAGLPAIQSLIAEGVNVNVTLLFGLGRYGEVVEAFLGGLEHRARTGAPLERVASVASFFVSRIDTLVDAKLDALGTPAARDMRGRAAIASARLAYAAFGKWTGADRWRRLVSRGAHPQRLLWASTSTKNPAYSDTMYVETLVGPLTVNTMTRATIDAWRDHGKPRITVMDELDDARAVLATLKGMGIDPQDVSRQLEREGVRKFVEPFDELQASLARSAQKATAA